MLRPFRAKKMPLEVPKQTPPYPPLKGGFVLGKKFSSLYNT